MTYPNFYPDDLELPPKDAIQMEIVAYRLVGHNPPEPSDFLATIQEYPNKIIDEFNKQLLYGTSFFETKEDILRKKRLFKPLRSKQLAIGNFIKSDGVFKYTLEKNHLTGWLKSTASPCERFKCMDEE